MKVRFKHGPLWDGRYLATVGTGVEWIVPGTVIEGPEAEAALRDYPDDFEEAETVAAVKESGNEVLNRMVAPGRYGTKG